MPLAVALVELVQTRSITPARERASVEVEVARDHRDLIVRVCDDGVGVPDGVFARSRRGLGLAIVRTFVVSDLGGTITIGAARTKEPRGALVEIRVRGDAVIGGGRLIRPVGQAGAAARCLRRARRITRRSSSEVPPQTPVSWLVLNANSRQAALALH